MKHTDKQKYVYLISAYHMNPCGYIKVGITQDFKARKSQLQSSSPFYIMPECLVETETPYELEQDILANFKQYRIRGEWFSVYSRKSNADVIKITNRLITDIKAFMIDNSNGEVAI